MPYTIDSVSADCYPGTTVLINKFDLHSQQELDAVEAALVTAKAIQWEEAPLCTTFDFTHYREIHHHLFCDLYDWAGQLRTINISKKGTQFCPASEIERIGNAVFSRLAANHFLQGLPMRDFVPSMVDLYESAPMSSTRSGRATDGRSVYFSRSWRRMQAINWIFPALTQMH